LPTFVSLNSLEAAGVTARLSSSSAIIGDKTAILSIDVSPSTVMAGSGKVMLTFPFYYDASGSDQMIGSTYPACSGTNLVVRECFFNLASR